ERIGVVAIPLNTHSNLEEVEHILHDAGARLLFAHADLLQASLPAIPRNCKAFSVKVPSEIQAAYRLHEWANKGVPGFDDYHDWVARRPAIPPESMPVPYRMLYTSGTTGRPKGAKRTLGSPEAVARMAARVRVAHG